MGLRTIISALVRRHIWVWPVSVIVIVIVVIAGFLTLSQVLTVNADDEQTSEVLDCLGCHPRKLEFHDKLGSGNKACWVCHDSTDMGKLRLADGTKVFKSDLAQICGQCHHERYQAWKEGTHGILGTVATVNCTACHDPHQPQISLLDIIKPHPRPAPSPPPPSVGLLMMFGISYILEGEVCMPDKDKIESPGWREFIKESGVGVGLLAALSSLITYCRNCGKSRWLN